MMISESEINKLQRLAGILKEEETADAQSEKDKQIKISSNNEMLMQVANDLNRLYQTILSLETEGLSENLSNEAMDNLAKVENTLKEKLKISETPKQDSEA